MAQESTQAAKTRAAKIYTKLKKQFPDAHCALKHRNAWELLAATILSAQCTDERVNLVTPGLFAKYPDVAAMAGARQEDVEKIVRSTGFYKNKARALVEAARQIVRDFGGRVPDTMEPLLTLRGVARKTANVVLGNAYGKNEGVVVDTHVKRLAHRMGLTRHTDPQKIEKDLMELFPRKNWAMLAHLLIWHGRQTCYARKPDCEHCVISKECPKIGVK